MGHGPERVCVLSVIGPVLGPAQRHVKPCPVWDLVVFQGTPPGAVPYCLFLDPQLPGRFLHYDPIFDHTLTLNLTLDHHTPQAGSSLVPNRGLSPDLRLRN